MNDDEGSAHFTSSVLRERIVEHVFVGELLRRLWQRGVIDVEVLRSEFDAGGYDLVFGWKTIIRHVQFKTVRLGGKAGSVKVSLKLAEKPSGCVIWIVIDDDLRLAHYLWYGGAPGEPLPDIQAFPIAKHVKPSANGKKAERPGHRVVAAGRFAKLDDLDAVIARLFGSVA